MLLLTTVTVYQAAVSVNALCEALVTERRRRTGAQ